MTGGESEGSEKSSTSWMGDSVLPLTMSAFCQCHLEPQLAEAAVVTGVPAGAGEPVRNQVSARWFFTQSVMSIEPAPVESMEMASGLAR